MGVVDLVTMGYPLKPRWEWLAHTDPSRIWNAAPPTKEMVVQAMFEVTTTVQVGNGRQSLFWQDRLD
jgi:hypothetical protein